jgi:hypothetical protein
MRPVPDNALLRAADFARADHLLKRVAIIAGAGVVIGIAWYALVGLRAGA